MEDWNEPQLVLAVHRANGLTGAAKALDIDHSTAFRRLNALETRLGVRLFERLPAALTRRHRREAESRRLASGWKMKRSPSTATLLAVITVSPAACG